jgi:hypothetical protein
VTPDLHNLAGQLIGIAMMVELGVAEDQKVADALREIAEELLPS